VGGIRATRSTPAAKIPFHIRWPRWCARNDSARHDDPARNQPNVRTSASLWSSAIRVFGVVVPREADGWIDAIRAELHSIPSAREQRRFALSSMRGLLTIAFGVSLRRWARHARGLAIAVVMGMVVASFDVLSDTRWYLRVGLLLSCVVMGLGAPGISGVSGLILGLSLPLLTAISGNRGPYETDVGDVWIPLLPAVVLTSTFGWLRESYRRHNPA
jgi:hypothetical protein